MYLKLIKYSQYTRQTKSKQQKSTVNTMYKQCHVQSTINSIEPSILQNTQGSLQQATKLNLINLHFSP